MLLRVDGVVGMGAAVKSPRRWAWQTRNCGASLFVLNIVRCSRLLRLLGVVSGLCVRGERAALCRRRRWKCDGEDGQLFLARLRHGVITQHAAEAA